MAIELNVNAADAGEPYHKHWSVCVGAGRANEGLRAGWLEHLRAVVAACGFKYVRFHGLFHDDMFVYRETETGEAVYNFQYVNDLFDRLLDAGIRPFVEIGFCPAALARTLGTVFWWKANASPPTDEEKWCELVRRTVQNWIDRYGIDEVRQWYFEIWNEPNLHPFFEGTKSEYLRLYKITVRTIKAVDARLRVGGPATSSFVADGRFDGEVEDVGRHALVLDAEDLDALDWQPVWLADFFRYCAAEHLPVDFVSCHPYPTDWALDAAGQTVKKTREKDATRKDLTLVRRMTDAGPFPDAEIHITEWSSSPSARDHSHDYPQEATFIVKANVECIGLVESLSYWTFTDVFEENAAGDTSFHGGFGMINFQGVPKPSFHAYRMLNGLGERVLSRSAGAIATRHADGSVAVLAYHYPAEVRQAPPAAYEAREIAERTVATGTPETVRILIENVAPGTPFVIETLDITHGNAIAAWQAMGCPEPMSREQTRSVKEAAAATDKQFACADAAGILSINCRLAAWGVLSVRQI